VRRKAVSAVVAGCFAALVAGCGGGGHATTTTSTASHDTAQRGGTTCQGLKQQLHVGAGIHRVRLREPFVVGLDQADPSTRARVRITALRAVAVTTVRDRYGAAGTFRAPGRFLAIVYRIKNLGPGNAEPASAVNRFFDLAGAAQDAIVSADRIPACRTIAASFAKTAGHASPEGALDSGASRKTVAVYALPAITNKLEWVSRGLGIAVVLGTPSTHVAGSGGDSG
jgi:hypothetical protein